MKKMKLFFKIILLILAKILAGIIYCPVCILKIFFESSKELVKIVSWIAAGIMAIAYISSLFTDIYVENNWGVWMHVYLIAIIIILASAPFWLFVLGENVFDYLYENLNDFLFYTSIIPGKQKRKIKEEALDFISLEELMNEENDQYDDEIRVHVNAVFFKKGKTLNAMLDDLNNMIGLANVKNEIENLIKMEMYQKQRVKQGLQRSGGASSYHLIFAGNPGTGKTTVARMVAGIYKELGIVSKGQFVEVDRSKLVGQYVGQTAKIVHEVVKQSVGGILFIDEAYTLINDDSFKDSFGHEALDTLLKEMEDHRNNLVVIVAGYTNMMEKFIESNPGLKSRFKKTILFEDYSPEEMLQIFESYCEQDNNVIYEEARMNLLHMFQEIYENRTDTFGNGRTVRNIYNTCLEQLSNRVCVLKNPTKTELQTIMPEDIAYNSGLIL